VLLVEGDAEEILIPILIRKTLGVSLDELGVSLINIRSTGFENVATLFHDKRVKRRCSVITDLDTAVVSTTVLESDSEAIKQYRLAAARSQKSGLERQENLEEFAKDNKWVETFYATHTFEVDFAAAGNTELIEGILEDVYTDEKTIAKAQTQLQSGEISKVGPRILTMAKKQGKGWFAILLGGKIDGNTPVPRYIIEALHFAHQSFDFETMRNILNYRLSVINENDEYTDEARTAYREILQQFHSGDIDLQEIKMQTKELFPEDRLNDFLEVY
jgi:putative ATP-dependent endonuclease of OLD family